MCGICGFVANPERDNAGIRQTVLSMCRMLRHRGPDETGCYIDAGMGLALGHQRLSIIDLASGQQPLGNEDDTIQIVFNGEVYNFMDLRETLETKGHRFRTRSDTETIVHAYEEWGTGCVARLRGMFAFAIWDQRRQRLFCARDRLGIKPFYYFHDGRSFIFASEIKAVLAHSQVSAEINPTALVDYLRLFYVPAPETIFKNIWKLKPGHILLFEGGRLTTRSFWRLDKIVQSGDSSDMARASMDLRSLLEESVNIRLISEVPLGAFLSGGVDSSVVVSLMSRLLPGKVQTNTVAFDERKFDESSYAREIADRFHCDHSEVGLRFDIKKILPRLVWHMDEPFADSSMIPTYYICQAARRRVTVCLSGDGGDELFAGYNWYAELQRLRKFSPVLGLSCGLGFGQLARRLPATLRGSTLLRNLCVPWAQRHVNLMAGFTDRDIAHLTCSHDLHAALDSPHPLLTIYDEFERSDDPVWNAQFVDLKSYMVEDILMKVDKMSMANSLEVRVPILDHKVVELAFAMATELKLQDNRRKVVLKQSAADLIRPDFFERPKQGFSVPLRKWLHNDLQEYVEDCLLSSTSMIGEYLDRGRINTLWRKMNTGRCHIDLSQHVWALLCLELWSRTFLNSSKGREPLG